MRAVGLIFAYVIVAAACSGSDAPEVSPTRSTGVEFASISVMVSLPEVQGALLGPASGRVVDAGGAEVATFGFESGWVIPPSWDFQGTTPPRSGASTTLTVELPAPGPYTFELDDFSVSGPPCGTCAARFEGGRVTVEVMDGTVVELPAGEQLAVS